MELHEALVDSMGIPEDNRFQKFNEWVDYDFEAPADRTDAVTIIQITMFPGRSFRTKKNLYQAIVHNLAKILILVDMIL